MSMPASGCEAAMTLDIAIGALITVGLFIYMGIAMLWPEKL